EFQLGDLTSPPLELGKFDLAFQDNGPGMTKESLANIFEPFFTTKEVGKGTGLGLSVVYGIVKNHNGYIFCESTPGAGTDFHIYFPVLGITAGEIALEEPSAPVEAGGGSETILLVDDEKSILEITGEILTMSGYRVITAESGEEALEIYQREKGAIHLVVLDLIMPGMGGHECLLALVKINPLVKVMITSGYTAQITTQTAIKSGAARFINKPYQYDSLLEEVRGVLDEGPRQPDRGLLPLHKIKGV
ncbi:MAG: response regulator, partial [Smithellaceae bacterium]|nr:response regulator [Smithellaceae bacterium]